MHRLLYCLALVLLCLGLTACQPSRVDPTPEATAAPGIATTPLTPTPVSTAIQTPVRTASPLTPIAATTASPVFATASPVAAAGLPVHLQIPNIDVDAAIEHVGKDGDGNMGVPEAVNNVAWYTLGSRPGAAGSAVMAGHLDTTLHQPAVFWRLAELREGDMVMVTDDVGNLHEFAVTGVETYGYDEAPIARIFGAEGPPTLNLITCKGAWDRTAANYNERLVVYTRLVEVHRPVPASFKDQRFE